MLAVGAKTLDHNSLTLPKYHNLFWAVLYFCVRYTRKLRQGRNTDYKNVELRRVGVIIFDMEKQ